MTNVVSCSAIALAMGMRPVIWTGSMQGVAPGGSSIQWDSQGMSFVLFTQRNPTNPFLQTGASTPARSPQYPIKPPSKPSWILLPNSPTPLPPPIPPPCKASSSSNTTYTPNPSTSRSDIQSHTRRLIIQHSNSPP
jgi:hypothetical protein